MNNTNREFLNNITKDEALLSGAAILSLSLDGDCKGLFISNEFLSNLTALAKAVLEKPLTARSRSIKGLMEELAFSTEEFKVFYFHLIAELNKFVGLTELSKLYPSNIEASIIIPYVECIQTPREIEKAYSILESNCWWYSKYQNSQPKGLLRLQELHPKNGQFDESISEPLLADETPSGNSQDTNEDVIAVTELIINEPIKTPLPTAIPEEELVLKEEPIPLKQSDLSIDLPVELATAWLKNDSLSYKEFVSKESFVALTDTEQSLHPLINVVKAIEVSDSVSGKIVLQANFVLQNVKKETSEEEHLAIWLFEYKTELEDKELKKALASLLTLLIKKVKKLSIPLVIDEQYNVFTQNKPKRISLTSVCVKDTGEIIFPGFSGDFVYVTK